MLCKTYIRLSGLMLDIDPRQPVSGSVGAGSAGGPAGGGRQGCGGASEANLERIIQFGQELHTMGEQLKREHGQE